MPYSDEGQTEVAWFIRDSKSVLEQIKLSMQLSETSIACLVLVIYHLEEIQETERFESIMWSWI